MSALLGIAAMAALFLAFGWLERRGGRPPGCGSCGEPARRCAACPIRPEETP